MSLEILKVAMSHRSLHLTFPTPSNCRRNSLWNCHPIHQQSTGSQRASNVDIQPGSGSCRRHRSVLQRRNQNQRRDYKWALGGSITNMGSKITYTNEANRDFIPINLPNGTYWETEIDEHNRIGFGVDFNKLMVPTPQPIYLQNSAGQDSIFSDGTRQITGWTTSDDPVVAGMFSSFGDAPGGIREELREFITNIGMEYWYEDNFAIRAGYFHEAETKGGRKYLTLEQVSITTYLDLTSPT